MSQTYLIACDLDGTLLTKDKRISERNKKVLQTLSQLGHHVVIATGRPFHNSFVYYEELQLQTPMINFNGGYVHHPRDDSFPKKIKQIPRKLVEQLIHSAYYHSIRNIQAESINHSFVEAEKGHFSTLSSAMSYQRTFGPILQNLNDNPHVLVFYAQQTKQLDNYLQTIQSRFAQQVKVHRWGPPWNAAEVNPPFIDKATGIKHIAEYYGIPRQNIITFGDAVNDIEMIQYAGHGVAMGNAIDELKELANDVTASHEQDGIAIYLERFFQL